MSTLSHGNTGSSKSTPARGSALLHAARSGLTFFDLGKGTPFLAGMVVFATLLFAWQVPGLEGDPATIAFFIALNCLAAMLPVNVYGDTYVTASLVITIPLIALYGPAGAALAAPLQAVAGSLGLSMVKNQQNKRTPRQVIRGTLSSAAIATIVLTASAFVYQAFDSSVAEVSLSTIPAVIGATVCWFALNVALLSASRAAAGRGSFRAVVEQHLWLAPHTAAMGVMGMVLLASYEAIGVLGVIAFATPALMMRMVMKQYTDKTEDNVVKLKEQNAALKTASDELRQSYNQIQFLALHDVATGLENRTSLLEHADADLNAVSEPSLLVAVGTDRLSEVAHAFGQRYADEAITDLAHRLRAELAYPDASIARIGEDRLGIYMKGAGTEAAARDLAATVIAICSRPVSGEGHLSLGPRIGMSVATPDAPVDAKTLMRRAEMALQHARQQEIEIVSYESDMDDERRERLLLLGDLERAISENEFWLAYQPQVDLDTGETKAVEALLRWRHPTRGSIPPAVFIPLAESAGFMRDITNWVARTAAAQNRAWRNKGLRMPISINISAYDLRDEDFAATMQSILWAEGVKGTDLLFEVTESALVSHGRLALETLHQLNDLGYRIAIDDFGTGYSSLAYLRELPVQELKVDRSFVIDLTTDPKAEALLKTITQMGNDLGMSIVTEGIEDLATLKLAMKAGCRTAQGYYFSKPLTAADLERWINESEPKVLAA